MMRKRLILLVLVSLASASALLEPSAQAQLTYKQRLKKIQDLKQNNPIFNGDYLRQMQNSAIMGGGGVGTQQSWQAPPTYGSGYTPGQLQPGSQGSTYPYNYQSGNAYPPNYGQSAPPNSETFATTNGSRNNYAAPNYQSGNPTYNQRPGYGHPPDVAGGFSGYMTEEQLIAFLKSDFPLPKVGDEADQFGIPSINKEAAGRYHIPSMKQIR